MERVQGMCLLELLKPTQDEHILDVGCGNGELTKEIAIRAARVVGIDNSECFYDEWGKARTDYENLEFQVMNAANLEFQQEFNAVFSHHVIHHIKTPKKVISSVWDALKPGGRFVAEFYGHGTARSIIEATEQLIGINDGFDMERDIRWYLPTMIQYQSLLEARGFEGISGEQFDHPEPPKFEGLYAIKNWLEYMFTNFFEQVGDPNKISILETLKSNLIPQFYQDGEWLINYTHIRIIATKPWS